MLRRNGRGLFLGSRPEKLWPAINQGDAAILFSFIFLSLSLCWPWRMEPRCQVAAAELTPSFTDKPRPTAACRGPDLCTPVMAEDSFAWPDTGQQH